MVSFSEFAANAIKPFYKSDSVIHDEIIKAVKTSIPEAEDKVNFKLSKRNTEGNRATLAVYAAAAAPYLLGLPIPLLKTAINKFISKRNGSLLLEQVARGSNKHYAAEIGSEISREHAKSQVTRKNLRVKRQLDKQYRDLLDRETRNQGFKFFKKDPQIKVYEAGFNPSGRKILTIKTTRPHAEKLLDTALRQDKGALSSEMARLQHKEWKLHKKIKKATPTQKQEAQQERLFREYEDLHAKKSQISDAPTLQNARAIARELRLIEFKTKRITAAELMAKRNESLPIHQFQKEELRKEYEVLQSKKLELEEAAKGAVKLGSPVFSRTAQRSGEKSTWFKTSQQKQPNFDELEEAAMPLLSDLEKRQAAKKSRAFSFRWSSNKQDSSSKL